MIAERMQMLGGKRDGESPAQTSARKPVDDDADAFDDDIPF